MKNENDPSASSSDTTSSSGPGKTDSPSEADYLAKQQEQARAAISATINDMKQAAAQSVNVREWTRQHPWILMGSAAVAGAVVGMLVTPSKEETIKEFFEEKWEAIKDKLTPSPAPEAASRGAAEPAQGEKKSMLGTILQEVLRAAGPAITGLMTMMANQQGGGQDGHGPQNGNGHHETAEQTDPGTAI